MRSLLNKECRDNGFTDFRKIYRLCIPSVGGFYTQIAVSPKALNLMLKTYTNLFSIPAIKS